MCRRSSLKVTVSIPPWYYQRGAQAILFGSSRSGDGEIQEAFDNEFVTHIIQAADRNTENNERRGEILHWARVALFWVLGLTALAGIPYVTDQVRLFMPTQQAPKPAQTQPAAAPRRPSFPENRVIKEGRDPQTVAKK